MSEMRMIEADTAARMVLAASKSATDDAIRWLEMIERYGVTGILPRALSELRAKSAALSPQGGVI